VQKIHGNPPVCGTPTLARAAISPRATTHPRGGVLDRNRSRCLDSARQDSNLVHKQKLGLIDRRQGYFLSLNSQKSDDQDQRHRNDSKSESCHCFTLCFCALAPICAKLAGEMCELLHTSMIDYLDGNDKGGHTGGRRRTPQTQGMVGQAVGRSPLGLPSGGPLLKLAGANLSARTPSLD